MFAKIKKSGLIASFSSGWVVKSKMIECFFFILPTFSEIILFCDFRLSILKIVTILTELSLFMNKSSHVVENKKIESISSGWAGKSKMIESFFLFCQHSQRLFFFVTFVTGGKSSRSAAALSLGFENCHYLNRYVTF